MSKSAIVIGSGVGGLAAAIRLAKKGYVVSVFEANDYPGGKLTEVRLGKYRFDAGPSLLTLPEHITDLFDLHQIEVADYFQYNKLETTCEYFYPDGTRFTAWSDRAKIIKEFEEKLGEPKANVEASLEQSALLYNKLAPVFMEKSLHKSSTWLGGKAFQAFGKLSKFNFNKSMNQANEGLFKNEKTVQLFNRYATYNGSDPYQTPATFNIIPHLEFGLGAYFPEKGMHNITESLYQLAKKVGVQFHFNRPVKNIVVFEGQAKGVNTEMGFHKSDVVVSNMDMVATYKKLLKDQFQPKKLLSQPKSSSALIFYWGIKKDFKQLDLHNIFFSGNYKKEFEHIFKLGDIYDDPTVYINISSTQNPSDAPEGCQNWFTMINVPNNQGQNWDELIAKARKNIIKKLSEMLHEDIEALIEVEDILDPRTIESRTSSVGGALYGNSSNNKYAAFLRHPNFSKKIKHLYFCGGSVHPGGGIPLSILSAKIAIDNLK
ncbi:1-hydroxycarotenoid 3,4-desaturase CrtD [Roseivirga misakiensis]|uniref:Phytoene dehydrogenase n=1 Tax=Roseivirga misakiensis TaxID=1563681 RepID=A0A1E5T3H8_9BACT|nr:1-hydroxycarotenoid 3,4-desaturase CrtD [Roseivirga misakiensis]OEK05891.1 phytoene dehydrogenase [Roseivirga misakiensis]